MEMNHQCNITVLVECFSPCMETSLSLEDSPKHALPPLYLRDNLHLLTWFICKFSRYQFQGLDLIDRVPEEIWMEVCDIVQEAMIKTILKKKKSKKAKWLSDEASQVPEKRREAKAMGKRKDIPIWMQSSKKQQGEIRKPASVINAKK